MPELDRFDARLEHAVHAFADRAQTSVDAVAMAGRAIGHRRAGPWAALNRAVPVPASVLVVSAVLVAFVGWSLSGGGPFPIHVWLGPAATPTAAPTPSPTPRPTPTIAPDAPAYVTGTGTATQLSSGETTPGQDGISQTRGMALEVVTEMDDPRVTGRGTYHLDVDGSGQLGFASGTFRLEVPGGAWEGTCTGSSWEGFTSFDDGYAGATLSCWLEGSLAYAGMSLYLNHRFSGASEPDALLGTIVPAEPPSP